MLDIHLSLMLFVLFLFLTLLVLLNNMLFKPLLNYMDDRDNTISKNLKAAKSFGSNSDELNAKADENISNAKNEAATIRQKAIDAEKTIASQKVEAKQSELEKEYSKFAEQLNSEQESLKESLLLQVPQFKEHLKAKFSNL
ncbi:MAG: F0F1 ATP synthase subunit B' [Epsilonproteobacteria bacterium]|nr:MAG: F0F1 ATP synthase subunit B' [Campylobacterota bacterium]